MVTLDWILLIAAIVAVIYALHMGWTNGPMQVAKFITGVVMTMLVTYALQVRFDGLMYSSLWWFAGPAILLVSSTLIGRGLKGYLDDRRVVAAAKAEAEADAEKRQQAEAN